MRWRTSLTFPHHLFSVVPMPCADFVACFPKGTSTEVCSTYLPGKLYPLKVSGI
jgi:hypothetical protein